MVKYIRYVLIAIWALVSKLVGLVWFYILPIWTRRYATNVVFNYCLENDKYLKRLQERPIGSLINGEYKIYPYHGTNGGYIKYRKTSWLEYQLVFWFLWGWIDSDSNYDTTDLGFMKKVVTGDHFSWLPQIGKDRVAKEIAELRKSGVYGNAFDLGDARVSEWYGLSSTLWMIRNTAYGFNYMLQECLPEDKNWFYKHYPSKGWHFGYLPRTKLDGTAQNRVGRLVWFTEDVDKI